MTTVFGHGRLRLYLLKLLDESPRHGYEIISLLRDRFLGVYSPSPGTIYPRLARLEEEGLVTHEEVDGRKVYRLTDKGREELHARSSDLDDLEREITDSVRDIAAAVKQDVRDTISTLREELTSAAGGRRRDQGGGAAGGAAGAAAGSSAAGSAAGGGSGDSGGAGGGAEGGDSGDRSWWHRDWERFAAGWGAWGGPWSRSSGSSADDSARGKGEPGEGRRAEFDRALHDFSDRVRDVVRDAGSASEGAVRDLRRILDDTIEVIRRDAAGWGPPEKGTGAEPGSGPGGAGPEGSSGEGSGAPASDPSGTSEQKEPGGHGPFAQPPADSDGGSDPWSTAIREDQPGPGGKDGGESSP